jgi:iron complex outermembrane receptor protein
MSSCLVMTFGVGAAIGAPSIAAPINIGSEPLALALTEFARQSDRQILYSTGTVADKRTAGVKGDYEPEAALQLLLNGTGLGFRVTPDNAILVEPVSAGPAAPGPAHAAIRLAQSGAPAQASGSTAPNPASAPDEGGARLEDIVVTAQKREENLQKVPIAITAITGSAAEAAGVRTSEDLDMVVPGFNITRSSGEGLIYMRGVGAAAGSSGQESAVATFVDGVYQPSMAADILSLSDIDRVEVLRGPQGTLYGRNATGGALNIVTKNPSFDPQLKADIGYGNLDTVEGNFYASSKLFEHVAANTVFYYYDQGQGDGRNLYNGERIGYSRDVAVRSKLLIDLSDDTKILIGGNYSRLTGTNGLELRPIPSTITLTGQRGWNSGWWDVDDNIQPWGFTNNDGGDITIDQNLGFAHLKSISAYTALSHLEHGDLDYTPVNFLDFSIFENQYTFTQEIQINSNEGSRVKWIVGAFYLHNTANYDPFEITGLAIAPLSRLHYDTDVEYTKSVSGFGQAEFQIVDDTTLTLGGRITSDTRDFDAVGLGDIAGVGTISLFPTINAEKKYTRPTWRVGISHQFDEDSMGYATYSRGFKSGGFNLESPTDAPVAPETLNAYEIGFKNTFFDQRVRFNPAFYYYDYDNMQVTQQQGPSQLLVNAAKSKIYGFELEGEAAATNALSLRGGFAYTHARYTQFPNAPSAIPNPAGGDILTGADASGKELIRTPTWSLNLAAEYDIPFVAGYDLKYNITDRYSGGFYWDPSNRLRQPSYMLIDTQLVLKPSGSAFSVRLWSRNLLNKEYLESSDASPEGDYGIPAPPRTFGISFGASFH